MYKTPNQRNALWKLKKQGQKNRARRRMKKKDSTNWFNLNRKCVHVSSDGNKRRTPGADGGSNTSLGERETITDFHQIQFLSDQTARLDFLESQLRILMDPPPQPSQPLRHLRPSSHAQHRLRPRLRPHLTVGRRCCSPRLVFASGRGRWWDLSTVLQTVIWTSSIGG